ncbi:MAG: tail fiber domain-containing protein [Gammaproteobacteria bacterium]|nr:tail fiber domain-containing protein [Gammaproteobacteria bacterium]
MASIISSAYCRLTGSRISVISLCAILILAMAWASPVHAQAVVNCGSGGSGIQAQLDLGNDVDFTGTCVEDIFIGRDGLDVDGGGSGVIQGEISVRGADRVTLEGFTVQNPSGGDAGVFITEGAHVDLRNVTFSNLNEGFCVSRHAFVDIDGLTSTTQTAPTSDACSNVTVLDDSSIRMQNSTITNDTDVGEIGPAVFAVRGSMMAFRGNNSITNNGTEAALGIYAGSHASEDNASTGTGNTIVGGAIGFDVWQNSSFDMRQATVTAPDNFVGVDSALVIGSNFFGGNPANITVTGDVLAYQNGTMRINTNANMNGTVTCETNSTINTTALGGTGSVDCPYRVQSVSGTAQILVEEASAVIGNRTLFKLDNNGGVRFDMFNNNRFDWFFQNDQDGTFKISRIGSGGAELIVRDRLDGSGGQATLFVDGSIDASNMTFSSSRENKTEIESVEVQAILAGVLELPISRWRFKEGEHGKPHIGPMAEDFRDVFGLGDGTHISVTDAQGIALAAIQGLKVEKDQEISVQSSAIDTLRNKHDQAIAVLRQENQKKNEEISVLQNEMSELKTMMRVLMSKDQLAAVTLP